MNIDTLRRADGSFRKASVPDIRRCLGAGHVTHLQTERGTIAIRPNATGWTVQRGTQSHDFAKHEQVRVIRCCLLFLNGNLHAFSAGDNVEVEANQGTREGTVLAVNGEQVLVEYEMPGTTSGRVTTSLVLFAASGEQLTRVKTIPHKQLSKRWCEIIREQGHDHLWVGLGQRSNSHIPMPH